MWPLFLVFGLVLCPLLWGATDTEIEDLIIDQTRSRIGQEFYQDFVSAWEAPPGVKDYNIVIGEQNDPRSGSWVLIEVNDNLIYRALAKPGPEDIMGAATQAIEVTKEHLLTMEQYEKNLEGEDMKGKGIY
jgi:curli production assembly/transport component CsgE